jgi:hypothetical protein
VDRRTGPAKCAAGRQATATGTATALGRLAWLLEFSMSAQLDESSLRM